MLSHEVNFEQNQEAFVESASRELLDLKRGSGHLMAVKSILDGGVVPSLVTRRVAGRVWPHAEFVQPNGAKNSIGVFGRLLITNDSTELLKDPRNLLDPRIHPVQLHLTTQENVRSQLFKFASLARHEGWNTTELDSGVLIVVDPFRRLI